MNAAKYRALPLGAFPTLAELENRDQARERVRCRPKLPRSRWRVYQLQHRGTGGTVLLRLNGGGKGYWRLHVLQVV